MTIKLMLRAAAGVILAALSLVSCSPYDNFTTLFNTYYNQQRLMKEAEDEFGYQEEKKRVTPRVFVPDPQIFTPVAPKSGTPPFMQEFVIEQSKIQPVKIKVDSIIIKGSKILANHPTSAYVENSLFLMAKAFFYRSEWIPSEVKCGELIDKFPAGDYSPDAHLLWSKNLLIQRKFYYGKIMLSRTVDIAWQKKRYDILSEAFRLQADLAIYEGDYPAAVRPYRQAIAQCDDYEIKAKWQVDMSAILYRLGKFAEAERSFARTHSFSPDYQAEFEAYLYQAQCLLRLGKYKEAEYIMTRLESDGKYEEWKGYVFGARLSMLRLQKKEAEMPKAEKYADSAFQNNPAILAAHFERGLDFFNAKDYTNARVYFSRTRSQRSPVYATSDKLYNLLNSWDQKQKTIDTYLKHLKDTASAPQPAPEQVYAAKDIPKPDTAALVKTNPDSTSGIKTKTIPDTVLTAQKDTLPQLPRRKERRQPFGQRGTDNDFYKPVIKPDSVNALTQNLTDSLRKPQGKIKDSVSVSLNASNIKNDTNSAIKPDSEGFNKKTQGIKAAPPPKPKESDLLRKQQLATIPKGDTLKGLIAQLYFEIGRVHEELGNKDSSIIYYQKAMEFSPAWDSRTARYIHAYSRIIRKQEPMKSDSLLEVIVEKYPLTDYGKDAMKTQGYTDNFVIDTVAELYKSGNSLRISREYNFAVSQFLKLYNTYPSSAYAPRSLYAIGWVWENNLKNSDSALFYYMLLIEKYPGSEYANDVRSSVDYLSAVKSGKPIPDSLKTREKRVYVPPQQLMNSQVEPLPGSTEEADKKQVRPGQVEVDPMDIIKDPSKAFQDATNSVKNPEFLKPDVKLDLPVNPMDFFKSDKDKKEQAKPDEPNKDKKPPEESKEENKEIKEKEKK